MSNTKHKSVEFIIKYYEIDNKYLNIGLSSSWNIANSCWIKSNNTTLLNNIVSIVNKNECS